MPLGPPVVQDSLKHERQRASCSRAFVFIDLNRVPAVRDGILTLPTMDEQAKPNAVTILLDEAAAASDRIKQLLPLVYNHLRAVAQNQIAGERIGHTLAATALVHEAYLKLVGPREIPWQNRGHFYAAAAEAMRQILLDHAKSRGRRKRGGGRVHVSLDEVASVVQDGQGEPANGPADGRSEDQNDGHTDFIALDEAIRRLEARDPRVAQVVRLKYYAGLEIAQVALVLGVSERTVKNDWAFAKAWLERALRDEGGTDSKNRSEP